MEMESPEITSFTTPLSQEPAILLQMCSCICLLRVNDSKQNNPTPKSEHDERQRQLCVRLTSRPSCLPASILHMLKPAYLRWCLPACGGAASNRKLSIPQNLPSCNKGLLLVGAASLTPGFGALSTHEQSHLLQHAAKNGPNLKWLGKSTNKQVFRADNHQAAQQASLSESTWRPPQGSWCSSHQPRAQPPAAQARSPCTPAAGARHCSCPQTPLTPRQCSRADRRLCV